MKVLLLASGRSKRAKPIEDKNFLSFCGKYLIEHQIEAIQNAGFEEIILIGGAHNMERLGEVAKKHNTKLIEQEDLNEGMAGALISAKLHTQNDDIFVVSSNDIVDPEAFQLMHKAASGSADSYILAYRVHEYFPGGYLTLDGNRITGIQEKPGEGNEPSDLINLVLHIHKNSQSLFEKLENHSSENDDRYERALNELMQEKTVEAVSFEGYWQSVKFPWHALSLLDHFLSQCQTNISPEAQIAETAVIKGKVTIESGAKIFDHAVIQGPAYIGKNAIVANNALVRSSIIGQNSVVGYSTEVARSLVGHDTWFHSNYIGDSVIGDNCSFGAGAICANLRLDEKEIAESSRNKLGATLGDNIRIGVNTSLMPGVKIGSGTFIGSGITIAEDIEPQKFVYGETTLTIKDNRETLDPSARNAMMSSLKKD
ncbi:NTP transferase domain-containing protein [Patescibacteria group bacterium]|nr:NTP transferase domain-containing protein [Patescibacteria group bacterium]